MSDVLHRLNLADQFDAETMLFDCCGSHRWAELMARSRPFQSERAVLSRAGEIWGSLENADWLEAFAAHPKIGDEGPPPKQQLRSAEWSKREQSGIDDAGDETLQALAGANRLYEQKFGYIFIVCATGRSAEEMLEMCRRRLENEPDKEIRIAADEHRKITEIRLKKLLHS